MSGIMETPHVEGSHPRAACGVPCRPRHRRSRCHFGLSKSAQADLEPQPSAPQGAALAAWQSQFRGVLDQLPLAR